MSESGDYTPAPWAAAQTFATARNAYADHAAASMSRAVSAGVTAASLVPDEIECDAEAPLIIACDVTGSMGDWPAVIFSKLPYLEHEAKEYLGEDMKICFAAIGDAFGDMYPLQVNEFVEGAKLKKSLEKLVIEGNGQGSGEESYDIACVYFLKNVKFPNAVRKPILIIIGDEKIYPTVYADKALQYAKADIGGNMKPEDLFTQLKKKYAVYHVRKAYGTETGTDGVSAVRKQWEGYLGEDHVASLPTADRVVDVIFGILAKESGKIDYFDDELKDRQGKDKDGKSKIDVVMKSLMTIHNSSATKSKPKLGTGKSVTRKKLPAPSLKKSINLLDEDDQLDDDNNQT